MDQKKFKKLVIAIAAFIVITVIISVFGIVINAKKSAKLEIVVAPASAEIKIGGNTYTNGSHQFIPGTYPVEIKKDGFNTYAGEITLNANETNYLYQYLEQKDGGFDWYLNHEKDMMILNSIGDREAGIEAEKYAKKSPIYTVTPYYDEVKNHFQIVAEEVDGKPKVTINLNTCADELKPTYIEEAHKYLEGQGIKPADYDITYVGLCDNI